MQGHCEGEMLFMYDRRSVAFRAVVRATAMGIVLICAPRARWQEEL